jgi:hypothetical protein
MVDNGCSTSGIIHPFTRKQPIEAVTFSMSRHNRTLRLYYSDMPTRQPENMVFRLTGRNINYSPILDLTYIYRRRKIDTSNMNEVPFRFSVRVWTSMHTREDIEGSMIQYIGLSLGSHSFICGSASQCSDIESPLSSSGRIRDCVTVDVLIEVGSSCAYPCILIIKVYHPVNRRDSAVIEIRLLSMYFVLLAAQHPYVKILDTNLSSAGPLRTKYLT